ncbi:MAG: hypothetical protein KTR22_07345 [Flavobacteriaceae bacterium]|nr:hypothetical protein [Flavobacteriaceae bacterium]
MEKIWIIAAVTFLVVGLLIYVSMKGYVGKTFGKKWLAIWGNKIYFWQSWLFSSMACTALILYALKWTNVLNF